MLGSFHLKLSPLTKLWGLLQNLYISVKKHTLISIVEQVWFYSRLLQDTLFLPLGEGMLLLMVEERREADDLFI